TLFPVRGQQGSDRQQTQRWVGRAFAFKRQSVLETPVGVGPLWINQEYVHVLSSVSGCVTGGQPRSPRDVFGHRDERDATLAGPPLPGGEHSGNTIRIFHPLADHPRLGGFYQRLALVPAQYLPAATTSGGFIMCGSHGLESRFCGRQQRQACDEVAASSGEPPADPPCPRGAPGDPFRLRSAGPA